MITIYKLKYKIGGFAYQLWRKLFPSFSEFSQEFDRRMFVDNEMGKTFPLKKYLKARNPYFAKWGFNVASYDAEYYSLISGVKADHYVSRSLAVHYIYPYLSGYEFVPAYMDKNAQKKMLGLTDYDANLDVRGTVDIVCCSNGVFFDVNGYEISEEQALDHLTSYNEPMILKPSLETYGGHGVTRIKPSNDRALFKDLFFKYKYDFTFQQIVEQHPTLSAFNPTSLNTIRIVTYRKPNRERKVLYSCLRFGGPGSVIDNVCSGGGYTGVDINTGKLRDRKKYSYHTMEMPMIAENLPDEIPCWEKIKTVALALHGRLPHFDIIGWDFSVTSEGSLTLIEYNLRPGVGLQQAVGPMFSKEDLDELMSRISKFKSRYKVVGQLKFKDKPSRISHITNFGFQYI